MNEGVNKSQTNRPKGKNQLHDLEEQDEEEEEEEEELPYDETVILNINN